jgi:nitrite reductase (NADH) small subunit
MKTEWLRITKCGNIPLREGRAVQVGGREIAIFNLGDRFLAVENRCPHKGGPLSEGIVSGESVICPLHGWKIGLMQGNVQRPSEMTACVRTFATRVDAGILLLQVTSEIAAHFSASACPGVTDIGDEELPRTEGTHV